LPLKKIMYGYWYLGIVYWLRSKVLHVLFYEWNTCPQFTV
jgi:hypothetical protein